MFAASAKGNLESNKSSTNFKGECCITRYDAALELTFRNRIEKMLLFNKEFSLCALCFSRICL